MRPKKTAAHRQRQRLLIYEQAHDAQGLPNQLLPQSMSLSTRRLKPSQSKQQRQKPLIRVNTKTKTESNAEQHASKFNMKIALVSCVDYSAPRTTERGKKRKAFTRHARLSFHSRISFSSRACIISQSSSSI